MRRLGLFVFGALLVALFVVLAITQGIGGPSVPSGAIAFVEDVPEGKGEISKADLDEAIEEQEAYFGGDNPPKPTPAQYKVLQDLALKSLIEEVWARGEIGESGVFVSDEEVKKEVDRYRSRGFESEQAFRRFLRENDLTLESLREEARSQMLSAAYQNQIEEETPTPSHEMVEAYYEGSPELFTDPESRKYWIISSTNRASVERAQRALENDSSTNSWRELAKQNSEDASIEQEYRSGDQESRYGDIHEPLSAAVFEATEHQLEGPLDSGGVFSVFEVQDITPPRLHSLESVEKKIEAQLAESVQKLYEKEQASQFLAAWLPRTQCAPGYVIPYCGNYESDPHPATADPACYEADPKDGLPKDGCPAPVTQAKPALPGSIKLLQPKGIPLAQRPHPLGENTTRKDR